MDGDRSAIGTFYNCNPDDPESVDFYCHLPVLSLTGSAVVDSGGGKILLNGTTLAIPEDAVQAVTQVRLSVLPGSQAAHPLPAHITTLSDYFIISSDAPIQTQGVTYAMGLITPVDSGLLTQASPHPDLWTWFDRAIVSDDLIPLGTFYDTPTAGVAQALINELSDDPAVPGQGLPVKAGFQFGAENVVEEAASCASSGGFWNGFYCTCPGGTHWAESAGSCVANTLSGGDSFSGFGGGVETDAFGGGGGGGGNLIVKVLTANVGNQGQKYEDEEQGKKKGSCRKFNYKYKLCIQANERHVASVVGFLDPDVVFLQELYNPQALCPLTPGARKYPYVCQPLDQWQPPPAYPNINQIDRILNPAVYRTYCALYSGAEGYECLSVRRTLIADSSCSGAGCFAQQSGPGTITDSCGDDTGAIEWEANFSSTGPMSLASVHTHTPLGELPWGECRMAQIRRILNSPNRLAPRSLVAGDFNTDPRFSQGGDREVDAPGEPCDSIPFVPFFDNKNHCELQRWVAQSSDKMLGAARRSFMEMNPLDVNSWTVNVPTRGHLIFDHIISDFADAGVDFGLRGSSCRVIDDLRQGTDLDHRSILCGDAPGTGLDLSATAIYPNSGSNTVITVYGIGSVTTQPYVLDCFNHGNYITVTCPPFGQVLPADPLELPKGYTGDAVERGIQIRFDVYSPWSYFDHWTGDCQDANQSPYCVEVSDDADGLTVGAVFKLDLLVDKLGGGMVTSNPQGISCGSTCVAPFAFGTVVTLTQTPIPPWEFVYWAGPDCANGQVTMDRPRICTAVYGTYLSAGIVGAGRVTSDPAGIDCGQDCSEFYIYGQVVRLSAGFTPPSWSFDHWEDDCLGQPNPATVTIYGERRCTAVFAYYP